MQGAIDAPRSLSTTITTEVAPTPTIGTAAAPANKKTLRSILRTILKKKVKSSVPTSNPSAQEEEDEVLDVIALDDCPCIDDVDSPAAEPPTTPAKDTKLSSNFMRKLFLKKHISTSTTNQEEVSLDVQSNADPAPLTPTAPPCGKIPKFGSSFFLLNWQNFPKFVSQKKGPVIEKVIVAIYVDEADIAHLNLSPYVVNRRFFKLTRRPFSRKH